MAKKEITFEELSREISGGKFAPVYVLMGEEPYFIDRLEALIEQHALSDSEREFNLSMFYGINSKPENIISAARQYPMMSERQIVVVKEAQHLDKIELLSHYVKAPMPKTVLIICYKYKNLDGRISLMTETKKVGVVFESKKIYDNKMPDFIVKFFKERELEIDIKSARMLADFIGNDISKLEKEADKLKIVLERSPSKRVTPEVIEQNIGISKDYNTFELIAAIASKDFQKANRIAMYFTRNPKKENAIQMVLPNVFNYFVNLLICQYAALNAREEHKSFSVMQTLNLKWDFQATDYVTGMKLYSATKVYNNIHELRMADARSKGFEFTNSADIGSIYKELLYKLMH
jgi:DNA polymerase-3 subunit delta